MWVRDSDQLKQRIFWTTVTVLAARPPAENPPPASAVPAPPAAVTPAGAVVPASGTELTSAELAATGLESERLHTILWAAAGLLAAGAALMVFNSLRRRRGSPA
ncbi:hypothetical protein LN996_06265 [Arthrobacter sp. AK01]|uniref:hypothetical protein n=1 Tax=Arthrobacter sp. AK01 TaxID=2894084 RepID=UPI001E460432|nr:hypothetical protein [Arthrobacter sp. AK01]MCD4850410.1 hypothetical protein [Arthrobacter sp. AK01]